MSEFGDEFGGGFEDSDGFGQIPGNVAPRPGTPAYYEMLRKIAADTAAPEATREQAAREVATATVSRGEAPPPAAASAGYVQSPGPTQERQAEVMRTIAVEPQAKPFPWALIAILAVAGYLVWREAK